jgi:MFS family permease
MTEISAPSVLPASGRRADIKRLMIFFALVYLTEGIGQTDGLIAQPINYYLKQVYQWTPVQIAAFLTVLNLPWFIKPLYGLVSDFVPLFGYRRKTYLIAANALAAAAYFLILQVSSPGSLVFLLLLTAYGMAIASTLCGALLVENGQKFDSCATFVNQQWLWFNVATIFASLTGGSLIEWLTPLSAVHAAAALAGLAPLMMIAGCVLFIDEERSAVSTAGLRDSFNGLVGALKSRHLWVIAGFLLFYYFSPGVYTPLYFYMTDRLKFSQQFIGILGSIQAVGWIAAALLYAAFLQHLSLKTLLNLSILFGVLATGAFVFLSGTATAIAVNFCYGAASMMTAVASLGLAANYCPKRSEGFAFAALMTVTDVSGSVADNVGSFLFEHVFNNEIYPLVLVAAAFTAVNFLLVPLLGLKDGTAADGFSVPQGVMISRSDN